MKVRLVQLFITCCGCAVAQAFGQNVPSAATPPGAGHATVVAPRTHVERFSTPEARAERAEAEATAKLSANANDAGALNARALSRIHLGRYAEAHQDLQRAVALQPASADYRANLSHLLWKLGRPVEAVSAARAALHIDDKNFTAHYQLGRFLLLGGDAKQLSDAAQHLRRALELDPRRSEVRFDLLTVYRALGDTANAGAQLNLLQAARPADPRVIYADALLASDRGDMAAAIRNLREALRLDPSLHGARQDLGLAFVKLKQWPEAVETFSDLSRRQADSVEAAYLHALALFNAGRVPAAEQEARRALRLNAGAAAAHTLLGIILASRGGADAEAGEALAQAVSLNPASFDAHLYLGRVQYALQDYAGAVASLRAALQLDGRHAEARFFLGTALEAAGDSAAALKEYEELVRFDSPSPYGLTGLGVLQMKQGKTEEAIDTLRRVTALDERNFEAHWALGRALALAERFNEAIESLQKAVALIPDRADAHYQLGLALRRVGRTEEAAREFALVERINKEFRSRTSAARP
ncbi:MAG: tetratricopeptide repeat protein [Pyrinomonadaceae bacterium]|nr:tetratricopeptide repeat protein [Acidobacteriota bacterium]